MAEPGMARQTGWACSFSKWRPPGICTSFVTNKLQPKVENEDDDENKYDWAPGLRLIRVHARCRRYRSFPALTQCQGGELNSRPRAYESPALPLSYPGKTAIGEEGKSKAVSPGFKSLC